MNPLLKAGTAAVVVALACYTVAVVAEQRRRRVAPHVLAFLTVGVMLDVTATAFMALGSRKGLFTLHGAIGLSSLLAMIADTLLLWRLAAAAGVGAPVPRGLHLYTRAAYLWWVAAFVTGGLLAATR